MRRRLFTIVSILSLLLLCVVTVVVLTVDRTSTGFERSDRFPHLIGPWEGSAGYSRLGVEVAVIRGWKTPVVGPMIPRARKSLMPQYYTFINRFPYHYRWNGEFGFEYGPCVTFDSTDHVQVVGMRTWIAFPFRALAVVLLFLPTMRFMGLPLAARIDAYRRRGGCITCGYNRQHQRCVP